MSLPTASQSWRMPDELWEKVKPFLPPGKPHPLGCHRPRVDDRKAMDAIFYRLRTGCQWKALDATGICSGSSAHRRFQEWTQAGVFQRLWAQGLFDYDELKGIEWEWQAVDGVMTKAPLGQEQTGPNPTDRAKCGVKRSLLVEGSGIPLGVAVDGANRNDFKMLQATLESIPIERPKPTPEESQHLCLDKGYDYDEVRELGKEFGYTLHIRPRNVEAQALKRQVGFKARRRVVERTHSWMNRFRSVLIRWDKKVENYLGLLHLACITYRATGLLG
jgi:putative transposase